MKDISYGKESDTNLKLIIGLARSSNNIRRSESDIIRNSGLTFPQFGVLEVLYHKGDLRVCQIIEKTLSTGGNMTVVIQQYWVTVTNFKTLEFLAPKKTPTIYR